ncbi:MAG TPA: hypothetical protein VH593_10805 [Ktedonobacteraceae bacterium]|jgi:hypothetical protein
MRKEQHDDHIWLVVAGESWAIHSIQRKAGYTRLNLWRGYEPNLEYSEYVLDPGWDTERYIKTARQMLKEKWR